MLLPCLPRGFERYACAGDLGERVRGEDRAHGVIAANLAAGFRQVFQAGDADAAQHRLVDQQRLGRAADTGAPHLGVQHDGAREKVV